MWSWQCHWNCRLSQQLHEIDSTDWRPSLHDFDKYSGGSRFDLLEWACNPHSLDLVAENKPNPKLLGMPHSQDPVWQHTMSRMLLLLLLLLQACEVFVDIHCPFQSVAVAAAAAALVLPGAHPVASHLQALAWSWCLCSCSLLPLL